MSQTKPENKPETTPAITPDAKPEVKPDAKPEVKPEIKPDAKPEVKPEVKPIPVAESKDVTEDATLKAIESITGEYPDEEYVIEEDKTCGTKTADDSVPKTTCPIDNTVPYREKYYGNFIEPKNCNDLTEKFFENLDKKKHEQREKLKNKKAKQPEQSYAVRILPVPVQLALAAVSNISDSVDPEEHPHTTKILKGDLSEVFKSNIDSFEKSLASKSNEKKDEKNDVKTGGQRMFFTAQDCSFF